VLDAAFTQPLKDGSLRCLAFVPQRIVHVPALFTFCRQSRCRTQVGLVNEHNHEFSVPSIGGVFDDPRRDLARHGTPVRRATLRVDGARRSDRP
jgi:hypothetical protein